MLQAMGIYSEKKTALFLEAPPHTHGLWQTNQFLTDRNKKKVDIKTMDGSRTLIAEKGCFFFPNTSNE